MSTLSLNIKLKPHSSKILWTKSVHICSKYYSCIVLAYVCIIAKNYFLDCNHALFIINCNWETTKFSLYHKLKYTVSYFENYFKTRPIYFVIFLFFPTTWNIIIICQMMKIISECLKLSCFLYEFVGLDKEKVKLYSIINRNYQKSILYYFFKLFLPIF